ncbi:hypothetical protein VTK73DRAFT_7330 [Phialemonium thermophilum]|uniref:Uncharacterized protein n=1 Tax=Phialemonium thermophilum TaxID=223376 RepID=A0ABR3XSY2_9PEZI
MARCIIAFRTFSSTSYPSLRTPTEAETGIDFFFPSLPKRNSISHVLGRVNFSYTADFYNEKKTDCTKHSSVIFSFASSCRTLGERKRRHPFFSLSVFSVGAVGKMFNTSTLLPFWIGNRYQTKNIKYGVPSLTDVAWLTFERAFQIGGCASSI